jgi:Uma2 family endonuclease
MLTPAALRVTADEFDALITRPENQERVLELVAGEVIEMPSNPFASQVSSRISGYFFVYLLAHPIAHLTGEAGGFQISGERYAPDVALTLKDKQAALDQTGYNRFPPDLAVEVDFPSSGESRRMLGIKIVNYLNAGTTVWVVLPELKQVEIYEPGESPRILDESETLSSAILPGFTLAVTTIFEA